MNVRLFHPTQAATRLAIVSVQSAGPGLVHVAIARGASRFALTDSRLVGPFAEAEGQARAQAVIDELVAEGYLRGGSAAMIETLSTSKLPRARAHAAERLGYRRDRAAVDALRARAMAPKDDISSVVIALGRIGDVTAVDVADAEAQKKLLSRRRAGAEAVRLLGDADAIAGVVGRAAERLSDVGVTALDDAAALKAQFLSLGGKRGAAIDALYDYGSDVAVDVIREQLATIDLWKPGVWRFAKSVLKRAMVRGDVDTFALLMRRIELAGRTAKGGTLADLKSGLDGETKATRVFSQRTADWLRRAAWRHLCMLARNQPGAYVDAAAAVLAAARDEDDVKPRGLVPATGHSYLLMRILYGASTRFVVDRRRPTHRSKKKGVGPPAGVREERFADLWDHVDATAALRRVLVHGQHRLVTAFALRYADARPSIIDGATTAELVTMLRHTPLWKRILDVLRARLSVMPLDTAALSTLAASENDNARALAQSIVTQNAHLWVKADDVAVSLLMGPPALREAAARLIRAAAPSLPSTVRAQYAARVVTILDAPLPLSADGSVEEGAFDGIAEIIDVFAAELRDAVDVDVARRLLARHPAGAGVAALVIGARADALALIGAPEVQRLAQLPDAASRAVVVAMMAKNPAAFQAVFGLTLELAEGEWDDVRDACVLVLQGMESSLVSPEAGGPDVDRILAIVDSTWPAVQSVGRSFISKVVEAPQTTPGTVDKLLACLAQHPHPAMHDFVLELASGVIDPRRGPMSPGLVGLLRLEPLLRAVLFSVRPKRQLRARAIAFIVARGVADADQAEVAARILADVARSRTHALRDDALTALVRIADAHDEARVVAAADGIVVAATNTANAATMGAAV
jgi:hypothetical protein